MRKISPAHINGAFCSSPWQSREQEISGAGWENSVFLFGLEYIAKAIHHSSLIRDDNDGLCIRASVHAPTCCGEVTISPEKYKWYFESKLNGRGDCLTRTEQWHLNRHALIRKIIRLFSWPKLDAQTVIWEKKGPHQMNQRRFLLERFNLHILHVRHIGKNVKN